MGPNSGVQEYCLRWNNHHSTLVSVMDALLQKGTLVDVTLAAEGKSIEVHRLVLCACSNYFQVTIGSVLIKLDFIDSLIACIYRNCCLYIGTNKLWYFLRMLSLITFKR